ncbi:MAG: 50S ribosomal protein L39e [Candidatus Altiarchaeota archaeon]|nr:50S ribosomal protein L39e [Candidatus Altiarchaeota archaeon]
MATVKNLARKIRLAKRHGQNRPMPVWVVMRTKRKVRRNVKRYAWRRVKLKR